MVFNFAHYYRAIPLNGAMPHVSPTVKQWMGNSRGHWEGNTLVVDVTGITGKNWLDQVGNFFSDNVHVVERFTLADANTIDYEVTIEDPTVFTRPWKMRLPLAPRPQRGDVGTRLLRRERQRHGTQPRTWLQVVSRRRTPAVTAEQ